MKTQNVNYDFSKLLKSYANKWVALSRDRKKVLGDGNTLKEVARKMGPKDGIFLKVFPGDSFYMPHGTI
ncbi:MAG: DUF5678 domain-containing protein [bacterium]|nr:DUF5678 domain-containing protein [bacterium]